MGRAEDATALGRSNLPCPGWNASRIPCPTLVQNQAWTQIIIGPILYNSVFGLNPNKGVASTGEAVKEAGRASDSDPTNGPTGAKPIHHRRSCEGFEGAEEASGLRRRLAQ